MSGRFGQLAPKLGCVAAFLLAVAAPGRAPGQVQTAVWSGTTGNWNSPAIWTTNPISNQFPNNGQPAGTTYNAQVAGNGTITLNVPITIDQLAFSTGTISVPPVAPTTLTLNTSLTWTGGTFSGGETISAIGGAAFAGGASGTVLDAATLNLGGSSSTWSGGTITLQNGSTLNNLSGSVLTNSGNGTLAVAVGTAAPVFNNSGAFIKSGGGTMTTVATPVNNIGVFEAVSGVLQTTGSFTNNGTLLAAGGVVQVNGPLTNLTGGTLTGGTYQVLSNSSLSLNGPVTTVAANTTVELNGANSNFASINSVAAINGTFRLANGRTFATAGDLTTAGTLDIQSGSALNVSGKLAVTGPASIVNGGTVSVAGTTTVNSALTVGVNTTLAGSQLLTVGATGSLAVQGTVTQPVTVAGVLSGNGSINNTVFIQPGAHLKPGSSPGTITVNGDMTLNGNYDWDLAGNDNTMAGGTFDKVIVSGTTQLDPPAVNANFSGSLSFADPFWRSPRTWDILDTGSFFDNSLPDLTTSDTSYRAFYPNGSFSLQLAGNSLDVVWNPTGVPEPGTTVLTAAGLASAAWAARRRKKG
jgi:fibronectin-binding autotransporter adhesin